MKSVTPPRTRAKRAPFKRTRRNPDELEQAAALSEKFHGRAARTVREVEEETTARDTLADLGRLVSLEVRTARAIVTLEPRGVRLAASPDGRQLYFVGGDQALDLRALHIDAHDHAEIGELERITYHTRKGFHNFEAVDYVHRMGEDGGRKPVLAYDSLNQKLFLVGGSYQVRPEGIVR